MSKIVVYKDLSPNYLPQPVHKVTLNRWEDAGTFPPKLRISANRVGWAEEELIRFRETRPPANEPMPVLWPPRQPVKGRGQLGRKHTGRRPHIAAEPADATA
jgi:predicted DNA-binding transcriptional regulator AlpA